MKMHGIYNTPIDQSVEMPLSAEQYASYFIRLIFFHTFLFFHASNW